MTKRWNDLTVDGVNFKVDTKATAIAPAGAGIRTVDDCYGRPSQYKRAIFEDWQRWFIKHDGWCSVASYNRMMFTLEGVLKVGKQLYRAYITKTRQELTPIV